MLITENSDHSTLSKNNIEEYIQSIATDPNLRGMLYHNLLQRNAILNQHNEKVFGTECPLKSIDIHVKASTYANHFDLVI